VLLAQYCVVPDAPMCEVTGMKTRRIGVAINTQHAHAEDQQLYRGIRQYSRKHAGFDCVLAPFAAEDLKASTRSRVPYDGILAQATKDLVTIAHRRRVPVVDVWRNSRVQVTINCVFPDFAKAGRMAGQHLASRGFENFGYVAYERDQARVTMCDATLIHSDELGYVAYLEARGFSCARFLSPENVDANASVWKRWSRDIRRWLVAQPKPLGLFVPEDLLCRYIAELAPELGLNIPHDLGLVCADNESNFCLLTSPSLTSLDLGYSQVGYEAAAMLDGMVGEGYRRINAGNRQILLVEPAALHPRHSTDAVAVRDPLIATAMRFVLEHTHEPIKVGNVADAVSTTRRTLERRFREVLDRTVMEEITRCRIERLKRRLAESNTPIKILAVDSGFNSARVLYETFVREEGMSPSAYRAKRRESIQPNV
jgi:LacI family transcriptional regulator